MQTFKNPILQKRHYEFIADILKDIYSWEEKNAENIIIGIDIVEVIEIFADKFAESNPVFDKKKFLDRIGVK
jgi:hypothetical protein